MAGTIRDSLFDGVHTFLSEQNQRNGGTWQGTTVGPGEDPTIHLTRVYVRLYATNPDRGLGRWFKWQPRGLQPHRLEVTDSVFAIGETPASWKLPKTTWRGTNFILWLAEGSYPGPRPAGVTVLEGRQHGPPGPRSATPGSPPMATLGSQRVTWTRWTTRWPPPAGSCSRSSPSGSRQAVVRFVQEAAMARDHPAPTGRCETFS